MGVQLLPHPQGIWERMSIKSEVLLAVRIFNVEPDHIIRHPGPVHLLVNIPDIFIGYIVPSALVVRNSKLLRKLRVSCKLTILGDDILGGRAKENENIQEATLREPVSFGIGLASNTKTQRIT